MGRQAGAVAPRQGVDTVSRAGVCACPFHLVVVAFRHGPMVVRSDGVATITLRAQDETMGAPA
jgi:hypothetical protein